MCSKLLLLLILRVLPKGSFLLAGLTSDPCAVKRVYGEFSERDELQMKGFKGVFKGVPDL